MALGLAVQELGMLEMVADAIQGWLNAFQADMREVVEAGTKLPLSQTKQLQELSKVAEKQSKVKERLDSWQALLQEKSLVLKQAAEGWASRRGRKAALSFKGFLGDTVLNPVADAYELLVRIRQLVARCKVMLHAGNVTRPADLAPAPLFVGPASACCLHLLRKLGANCIINCTTDVPPPDQPALMDMQWHRIALEDTEDQDLNAGLQEGLAILEDVVGKGGRAFVHCHEGKSRSVALCLAYLVTKEKRPLAEALAFVKSKRPQARPNAGFMRQLLALELSTLGSNSLTENDLPRGKPKLSSASRR